MGLAGKEASFFRNVDLWSPPPHGMEGAYFSKQSTVAQATIGTVGNEQVERGLQQIAQGGVPLTLDDVWQALAGDGVDRMGWFFDEVVRGQGIAAPRLEEVTVTERPDGWQVHVELVNDGDATTVVPLRFSGAQGVRAVRVRLEAGGRAIVDEDLDILPDQVLIDPDGEIVQQYVLSGQRWTVQGGVQ